MVYFHPHLRDLLLVVLTTLLLQQHHIISCLAISNQESSRIKIETQNCVNGFLKGTICPRDDVFPLVKLDGVKVGHVREMNLGGSKTHRVVTRSLRPLLFEIPEFLSHKECNHFIQMTQERHFKDSETTGGKGEGIERKELEKKLIGKNMTLEKIVFCRNLDRPCYDVDGDGKISLQEFIEYIDYDKQVHPTKEDASPSFGLFDLDSDGFVIRDECENLTQDDFVEFLFHIEKLKSDPRYLIRFSESTTLSTGKPIVRTLQDRIVKLTGLSRTLIEKSEPIQVVRYSVFGHYNVHYDTSYGSGVKEECCTGPVTVDCHLCRFVTILIYLNDVVKGGETAFPVADDVKRLNSRNYSVTLNEKCQEASLLIKPKKGTAIMWYNHLLEHDGATYMGDTDWFSLHGGCDVIEGVKWIANVWLNAPFKKRRNT